LTDVHAAVHTLRMRTSVTIPDATLRAADELARRMGISRSRLFAIALERLVQERRDDDAISAKTNEVLAHESSALDPVLAEIQYRSIEKNDWKQSAAKSGGRV
jgi:metal-responsive CopG/Arc/MetJ family transcriptional regulator